MPLANIQGSLWMSPCAPETLVYSSVHPSPRRHVPAPEVLGGLGCVPCFPAVFCTEYTSLTGTEHPGSPPSPPAPCPLPRTPPVPGGPDGLQLLSQAVLQVRSPEDAAPEVPAQAFRVVCDNMLGGLARTLRCLGVDVRVLHSGEDHRQAAEVSRPGPPASLRSHGAGGVSGNGGAPAA